MQRTTLSPAVLAFLERDRVATLNLAGILQNQPGLEILVDDEENPAGILVKGPWFWYLHTTDEAFLEAVCRELELHAGFYRFSGVWRPLAEKIKARFPLVWDAPCELYYLPTESHPPAGGPFEVSSVDFQDAECIDQHYPYRNPGSLEKIQNCIQHRNSSAIYVDGRIVCWLLVHEDNSLGIMHTLEAHRRKGYAAAVTLDLVKKQLADGRTPFLQIRDDNSLSPGLAQKCGFVQHGNCDWFGVVSGTPPELIEGGRAFRLRVVAALGSGVPDACVCLYRFLYVLKPQPLEENPVVEAADEQEWLAFAARHFPVEMLRASLAGLRKNVRLLWERREGAIHAVAAVLVDEDDGCELFWFTNREEPFLQQVLQRAKAMGLGTVFVHVSEGEQAAFEALGFRKVYVEDSAD